MSDSPTPGQFRDLGLPAELLAALDDRGYEVPTAIQGKAIPHLLAGRDLFGHAPTGTGKTAAFALPLLARLQPNNRQVQVMTLTPTRELAMQVAEAFGRYGAHIPNLEVLPIYGGQEYGGQIRALKRGVQVVVGTPGRVMDHMRKGNLRLDGLQALVLDEADEMLRMGFVDEVEWILSQTRSGRQMALFSATMPQSIQDIARRHLDAPIDISVPSETTGTRSIRQRHWLVRGVNKLDAMSRLLEVESFDGMLIFVRTKAATTRVAEQLAARGYATAALNGDMQQRDREQTVARLKNGALDILVATDVAARGLDVDRISHVINYDIPFDSEAYIHRIGRTGRAGRAGEAIMFVAQREMRMLRTIERATGQPIEALELPTAAIVSEHRVGRAKKQISERLATGDLTLMRQLVEQYQAENDVSAVDVAAALAALAFGEKGLAIQPERQRRPRAEMTVDWDLPASSNRDGRGRATAKADRGSRSDRKREPRIRPNTTIEPDRQRPAVRSDATDTREVTASSDRDARQRAIATAGRDSLADRKREPRVRSNTNRLPTMEPFRVEIGADHGVAPGNLVGAIANEAGLESQHIGRIDIEADFSVVELPKGMPTEIFKTLKNTWVCGKQMKISRVHRPPTTQSRDKPKTGAKSTSVSKGQRKSKHDGPKRKSKAA